MKGTVLVVDDQATNRMIIKEILKDKFEIVQAASGAEAISMLFGDSEKPDLILLDVMMPNMDGFQVMEIIQSNPATKKIPVMFITADASNEVKGLNAGAVDYIMKPFVPAVCRLRVENQIELSRYRRDLEREVDEKISALISARDHVLETMATIVEYRNLESGQHIKRVKMLTEQIVMAMLKDNRYGKILLDMDYETMLKAVPLHDLGKIGIPDEILLKPGKLTPAEFEIIKTHTVIGGNIINMIEFEDDAYLKHCSEICLYHHERWDGKGYPEGLKEEEIPLSARIVAIVDVYDALVSERVYKKAIPHEKAVAIISEQSGTQFDPEIVKFFLAVESTFQYLEI